MFIDCAKLEKILKADYKTWGGQVWPHRERYVHPERYRMDGGSRTKKKSTKEFLGTVIKTCGLAPERASS